MAEFVYRYLYYSNEYSLKDTSQKTYKKRSKGGSLCFCRKTSAAERDQKVRRRRFFVPLHFARARNRERNETMKKKVGTRILSLLMTLVMALSLLPAAAMAEEGENVSSAAVT